MASFSVVIRAHQPDRLAAACLSARWADEIVVVDASGDGRVAAVARAHADRYVHQPWLGFAAQARFAVARARHAWVLLLDQDEECSPELAREIRALDPRDLERCAMFTMPRRHYMFGRVVRSWDDRAGRLLHRDRTLWPDMSLHERCVPRAREPVGRLRGPLLHRRAGTSTFRDFFDGARTDARVPLAAAQLHADGRTPRWYYLALGPIAEFLKFYVLRGGFRDGKFGLLIAYKAAFAEHLRSASVWAAARGVPFEEPDHRECPSSISVSGSP